MARYKTQSEEKNCGSQARYRESSRWVFPPPRLISAAYANCNAHKMQALLGRAFFGLCNGIIYFLSRGADPICPAPHIRLRHAQPQKGHTMPNMYTLVAPCFFGTEHTLSF